jgi:alpha-mannosidase
VTAIKLAEDGDGTIVRCFETHGRWTRARISLPAWDRTIEACFNPGEIKTFHLPDDPDRPIRETNLVEWDECDEWKINPFPPRKE